MATNVSLASTTLSQVTTHRWPLPRGCVSRVAARRRMEEASRPPRRHSGHLITTAATPASAASVPNATTPSSPASSPAAPTDKDAPPRWRLVHARAVAAIAEVIVSRKDAQKIVRKALRPEWFGPKGATEPPGWMGDARGGGVNNAERAAIADAILGVEVLRLRLAFVVHARVSSASVEALDAAGGRDALGADVVAALLRRGGATQQRSDDGVGALRSSSDQDGDDDGATAALHLDQDLDLDRAAVVSAAEAMLALYWMRHPRDDDDEDDDDERDASNSTSRHRHRQQLHGAKLAVLLGGGGDDDDDDDDDGWSTGNGATVSEGDWPADPTTRIAVEHSLPRWLAERFVTQYGTAGAASLAAALLSQGPVTLRRNRRLCASAGELRAALAAEGVEAVPLTPQGTAATAEAAAAAAAAKSAVSQPVVMGSGSGTGCRVQAPSAPSAGAPDALVLPAGRPRCGIFGLKTYHRGMFEVQDAGSQCIARAVSDAVRAMAAEEEAREATETTTARSGGRGKGRRKRVWRVLDMCAGNGGKALAVASALSSASSSSSTSGERDRLGDGAGGRGPEEVAAAAPDPDADEIDFRIDCYDVDERRLRHLRAAAERAGVGARVNAVTASHLRAVSLAARDRARARARVTGATRAGYLGTRTRAEVANVAVGGDDDDDGKYEGDNWNDDDDGDGDDSMRHHAYDAVLVDVPCSSTGALRRFPSLRWEVSEARTATATGDDGSSADADVDGAAGDATRGQQSPHSFGWDDDAVAEGFDADAGGEKSSSVSPSSSSTATTTTWQALQRDILGRSAALVRPGGGALIYATCSLLDAENGDNARWFERRRWGWGRCHDEEGEEGDGGAAGTRFVPLPFPVGWPMEEEEEEEEVRGRYTMGKQAEGKEAHEVALLPHVHGTDGFYIARWVRD